MPDPVARLIGTPANSHAALSKQEDPSGRGWNGAGIALHRQTMPPAMLSWAGSLEGLRST